MHDYYKIYYTRRQHLREFLAATFPPPNEALDHFSGLGHGGDLIFQKPTRRGGMLVVIPLETAAFWQAEAAYGLPADTTFVVAPVGSLTVADLDDILTQTQHSGFLIDVLVLNSAHRQLIREELAPWLTDSAAFERPEVQQCN